MLLGTALALLFSAANVFFRDFSSAVSILTNFVRFGVPMIYPYSLVDERFGGLRDSSTCPTRSRTPCCSCSGRSGSGTTAAPGRDGEDQPAAEPVPVRRHRLVVCFVLLLVGQLVFTRLENRIPERL